MKKNQMTLAGTGFEKFSKTTRRAQFLADMEGVLPWGKLCALIEPVYPKGEGGRPAVPLERMLRIYFLQQWFNLSDPAVEEALYDMVSMREFHHQSQGLRVSSGTMVDATIISAPSSTKNAEGRRDPEMHQTMKGRDWFFGMKAHVGVDRKTKRIHSVATTPANVADGNMVGELLHGGETHVWGDAAYSGRTERIRAKAPKTKDFTQRHGRGYRYLSDYDRWINQARSRVRARVEHSIT